VWQNGPDHDGHAPQGGPDAHHQGDHDQRGPDRDGHDKRDLARHEQDHFAWRGNDFRKGHPAPAPFRGDEYRVRDWSDRGLPPPPEGHHWSYI
ncbi:RcnB family protein, partial [Escherichia coli]